MPQELQRLPVELHVFKQSPPIGGGLPVLTHQKNRCSKCRLRTHDEIRQNERVGIGLLRHSIPDEPSGKECGLADDE